MKTIIEKYTCDSCKKKLPEPHLSLTFGEGYSGWVSRDDEGKWGHFQEFLKLEDRQVYHFCSGECLEKFFKE